MRKLKPRSIDEWRICYKSKKIVKRELQKWLDMLIDQANGQQGNVIRADLIKDDIFYFTNCKDILMDDPECKSQETEPRIIRRKQKIMLQLLLKQILGEPLGKTLYCTHCGAEEQMKKMHNGHYRFCPHCKKVSFVGYLPTLQESVDSIKYNEKLDVIKKGT